MMPSLPTDPASARSLTGVWANLRVALDGGGQGWFPPARSAVLVAVDGLGSANLAARSGHARFLSARATKRNTARSTFPSTTATALTSLMTGAPPGVHGVVGYRVRVPSTGALENQLTGWDDVGALPAGWLRRPSVFQRDGAVGRPCFVVGPPEHARSGFTGAILRGAEYRPVGSVAEAMDTAADLAARHDGSMMYVYVPDLDRIGHKRGCESEEWSFALEDLDTALSGLDRMLPAAAGAVVTADHGMLDVPAYRQVLLAEGDPLLEGVADIGGEPRMLHLYVEPGADPGGLARAWRESEEFRSWVLTRDEAIEAGLFGPVDPEVAPRIGDVIVAARATVAYYDDRLVDKRAQSMVGQHGSLTPAERTVPLIPFGAFGGVARQS